MSTSPPNLNLSLDRWGPWRSMLASSAPEAFGALGALAASSFGLVQLITPTAHRGSWPPSLYLVPPEAWGMAFLVVGLWLFVVCFTGKRDDMEAPAVLLSIVWAAFSVLMVIPDAGLVTPAVVVLLIAATGESALVSLMAGGSNGARPEVG